MRGSRPNLATATDEDYYTLKRYEAFREAAAYVTAAFETVPAVQRVVLFGSVASAPRIEARRRRSRFHEPKDVDLAVWLDDGADLDRLRKLSAQALHRLWDEKGVGVAHHQVDTFLFDNTGTYMGRLCHFGQCPKHKPECRALGCGKLPFLKQHDGFEFDPGESLHPDRIRILFERR
jgi:predicted nucleotidyltransferase